jgi:hypothetical protein
MNFRCLSGFTLVELAEPVSARDDACGIFSLDATGVGSNRLVEKLTPPKVAACWSGTEKTCPVKRLDRPRPQAKCRSGRTSFVAKRDTPPSPEDPGRPT